MKPFTPTERAALVAGIALIIVGLTLFLWPREVSIAHAVNDREGTPAGVVAERVSKGGSRVYGVVALLFGAGFVSASVYGRSAQRS